MHMDIVILKETLINLEQIGMRMYIFQSQDSRLLHHITQITSQGQFQSLSFAQRRFDKENFTSDSGPCQTGHHTGIVISLIFITRIFDCSQIGHQIFFLDHSRDLFTFRIFTGQFTDDFGNLLIQFTRIRFYQLLQSLFLETHTTLRQAMGLDLLRYQMTGCNLHLFLQNISIHFDDFHTVQQRL